MKKYLRALRRHLNMPGTLRDRVISDLVSSIDGRLEAGQSKEQIIKELGSPRQAAAEINRQMPEYTYRRSPWRWLCLTVALLSGILLVFGGWAQLIAVLFTKTVSSSLGIIGGADGPTAIFITTAPGGFPTELVIALALFAAGILGFYKLSRLRRK